MANLTPVKWLSANATGNAFVNTDGEVVANGFLGVDGSRVGLPSYGGCYEFNESGSALSLTGGAFSQWVTGSEGTVRGAGFVTFNATDHHLVIGESGAGVYVVHCAFAGALSAADDIDAVIYKTGVAQNNLRCDQAIANQASYQAGAISGLITLAANDTIDLRFATNATTRTWTVKHVNLCIIRVA